MVTVKSVCVIFLALISAQLSWSQAIGECQRSYFGFRSDGVIFSLSQFDEEVTLRPDIRSEEFYSFPFQYKTVLFGNKDGPVGLRPLFSFGPASNDMLFTRTGDRAFIDVSNQPNGKLEVLSIDLINGDSRTIDPAGDFRLQHGRIGTSVSPNRVGDKWIFNLRHGLNMPPKRQDGLSVLINIGEHSLAGNAVAQPFTTRGLVDLDDDHDIELQLVSHDLRSSYVYMAEGDFAETWPASDVTGIFQIQENRSWAKGTVAVELTYRMDAPRVNGRRPYEVTQFMYSGEGGLRYQRVDGPEFRSFQYDGAGKEFIWLEKILDAEIGTTVFESSDALLAQTLNDYKTDGWDFFAVHERNAESRKYIIRLSAHPVHEVWEIELDDRGHRSEETLLCASGRD